MAKISQDFIEHISKQGLDNEQLESFIDFCQKPLRRSIRINSLHFGRETILQQWQSAGYKLDPIPWVEDGFWIDEAHKPLPAGLGNYIGHQQGQFYIQEASSMLPVAALFAANPQPKMILDMAAAPGSKTTQIAAKLNNTGLIVANELSSSRLKGLFSNVQRCGVANVCLTHSDGRVFGEKTPEQFDAILLDAPCGGEGTVRKDPDALEDWSLDSVLSMSELQKELIVSAFKALKPNGTLVYSTCTLSREENQNVCQHLLDTFSDQVEIFNLENLFNGSDKAVTKEGYLHVFPQIFDSEGFFVACFKKVSVTNISQENIRNNKFPFTPIASKDLKKFKDYAQSFAWDIKAIEHNLWQRKNEIWYFPNGIETLIGKIKMDRMGVKLAQSHNKGYNLEHQAAISFGSQFNQEKLELSAEQAQGFYLGKDIYSENSLANFQSEIILTYQNQPIGVGKKVSNRIKNKLPRDLVRDSSFYCL